ncbi:ROK family glucokinase [Lentibacillus sediminis]|uniref:ROK family glucokinase n=1 Tax=Lentibacillus sediminis TaxID=1940529 RepID=UPI000C1C0D2E|nr:ROK family glucokinase [Lentibacillus sediminis]
MSKQVIGIDIGGTTVKIGMLSDSGDILDKWEIPTKKEKGGAGITADIWQSITAHMAASGTDKTDILGMGVGAPGFIDGETGFVYEAVNVGWKDFPLAEKLKQDSGLPVFVINDANIAVLGENWRGAGNQAKNVIAITLGTGVGGGIIANGQILNGENGMAGEIGHITVELGGHLCNCGRRGCLETVASATGMVRQAMHEAKEAPVSLLAARLRERGEITSKDIFELAEMGDQASQQIIDRTADVLGLVLANMGAMINPSKILIGGGVSKAGEQLIDAIRIAFEKYALARVSAICDIKAAQLGNDAGIIGGAFLVEQKLLNVQF